MAAIYGIIYDTLLSPFPLLLFTRSSMGSAIIEIMAPTSPVIGGGKQYQMGAFSRRIARASRVLYHFVWREIAFRRYELFIGRWHGKGSFFRVFGLMIEVELTDT